MLSVTSVPGIIEGGGPHHSHTTRRRRSSQRLPPHHHNRRPSALLKARRNSSRGQEALVEVHGISMDRLTYINTALEALPGIALREYFVPIMRLKKQLLLRQRNTRERFPAAGTAPHAKMVGDAVASLAKALETAGGDLVLDGGTASLEVDPKALAECLKDRLVPICVEPGGVLSYPREPPEVSFVYVVFSGTITAVHYVPQPTAPPQQQQRRGGSGGGGRKERQTYFTSAKDVVRLCGGGAASAEAAALLMAEDGNGTDSGAAAVEAASMSNVTTAIQRSLRRASRTVGQPTLQQTRIDQLRGPTVLGAAEALGLAPCRYVSYTVSTEVAGATGRLSAPEPVVAFRVRTAEVHAAVIRLAAAQQAERQGKSPLRPVPWCAAPAGEAAGRGAAHTTADFIVAARRRTLYNDYAAVELMMRQSWLLQDAPSHTIRTLIAHLEPRTYMPGEVIACPHTPGGERQLCFLRRGRLHVFAAPKGSAAAGADGSSADREAARVPRGSCECWLMTGPQSGAVPAEIVDSGASFGELSVLFQEPRNCVLRADTVCDAWCLPHRSFTLLMQRDASLRDGLLQKAAVLRIEWMGEQRFTRSLAHALRASSELLHPLPDIAIRLIQERLEPVVYAPGSLVVSTSSKCTEMIFLMHGTVTSICAGVATYGPGDVLGEGCLVPHRWPLGLAARTMVEGWRIKADQLSEALRRVDMLHSHSGVVTSQTPQLMKQIFGNPQPEIEVDAVGRQRMPTVDAAPGGMSYLAYGRAVSEVQLKAICFLHRDLVRWEDINYSTIDGGAGGGDGERRARADHTPLDHLAREQAIRRLRGGKEKAVAAALSQQQQQPQRESAAAAQRVNAADGAAESPAKDKSASARQPGKGGGGPAAGSGRNAVRAGAGPQQSQQPQQQATRRGAKAGGSRGPRSQVASAGAFLVKNSFLGDAPSPTKPSSASVKRGGAGAGAVSARDGRAAPLPPRLQRMARLLEERNRTWAAEQRHEATLAQQETHQREAALRDRVALHASTAASRGGSARGRAAAASPSSAAAGGGKGGAVSGTRPALADVSPAPVHIFLQAEKPKYELDLKEAISIGYVMQLPDIAHIQFSVSLVDPDVALGPPAQRARRHLMSVTPNDRHTKHNFLFAAAALEDGSSAESQKAAAEAAAEATLRSKARKLYTMMRAAVSARMDAEAEPLASTPHRGPSGDYSPDRDSVTARPPDTLLLVDELQLRGSPHDDANGDRPHSPPTALRATPSPKRGPPLQSPPVARPHALMATPSPFRGSPGKSGPQRSEEAYHRVLQRDPVQAVDLLRRHYGVPWSSVPPGGVASAQSSPARFVHESRSTNVSGVYSAVLDASAESQRRSQRPSLLSRLEVAVAAAAAAPPPGPPSPLETPAEDAFGVVMTNRSAATYPRLVTATARDRWHGGNLLSPASAAPGSGHDAGTAAFSQHRADDGALASPAHLPDSGTLTDFFYGAAHRHPAPLLFVEGYGPLTELPEEWVEYPPTVHIAAAAAADGSSGGDFTDRWNGGSVDRSGGQPGGEARRSRPSTAIAAATALRRSTSRTGVASVSPSRGADSAGGGGYGAPPRTVAAPKMEPFVMPSIEDTEVVIRRIQRDVNGLNAVAKEQRRERDVARLRNGRIVKHRAAVAAALGQPDEAERELLEAWRTHFARMDRDGLRRASLPAALRDEGGPDYTRRELRHLAEATVPKEEMLWRYTADMQAVWQEEQGHHHYHQGGRLDASPPHANPAMAAGGGAGQDGPRRVVAAIGASRLGFAPPPLQSPSAQMDSAASQRWAREREDFFAAYKQLLDHGQLNSTTAAVPPLTPPPLRFTPAPPRPPSTASTSSAAVPSMRSPDSVPSLPPPTPAAATATAAVATSAELNARYPQPDLPARYDETPDRSYSAGAVLSPSAVDDRVAVTPPLDRGYADDTRDESDGSEEYSTAELDEEYDDEEEEEEAEEEARGAAAIPDAVSEGEAEVQGQLQSEWRDGEAERQMDGDMGEAEEEYEEEEGEYYGEAEEEEVSDADDEGAAAEDEDHPAWLDI